MRQSSLSLKNRFRLSKQTRPPLGQIRLTIGGDVHKVLPGDSWCIPGGVLHGAEIIEESVAVEVFSPVREDYLPSKEKII